MVERRPGPNVGKAAVVWEETGMCTTRAAGVGVQARREGCAETTSGRSSSQQGLTATCKDLASEGMPEARGGVRTGAGVRRSNEGRAIPADVVPRDHDERGNSSIMQRDSGHLAASGVPGHCRAGEQWSARGSKPSRVGVYVGQHLSFARDGKATAGRPRSEPDWGNPTVRDRRGACGNVDHGGTRTPPRVSTERALETLRLKLCAPQFYPDLPLGQ
jgi:hypothetical protein